MSDDIGIITKHAIGRCGFIGSLYDIRTDRFEGGNLFNQKLAPEFIITNDCPSSNYFIDKNFSQKDLFNKLNIEGSMKLNLMVGLLKLESSAKYLNQIKTESRTVRITFIYNIKTKEDHLQISMTDLYNYISSDALENLNATHCVIGIKWGACIAVTFEETFSTLKEAEEIQNQLTNLLEKIIINNDTDSQTNLENNQKMNLKSNFLKMNFSGDILIEDIPRTIEDVFNIVKKVPIIFKQFNDGKGKQLEYQLYPLKRIAEIFHYKLSIERMIIKQVTDYIIIRIENIFDEIINVKRMFNDYFHQIELWKDYLSSEWMNIIYNKKIRLIDDELKIKEKLSILLEKFRNNEIIQENMDEFFDKFTHENPCSLISIKEFFKENIRIKIRINTLKQLIQQSIDDENAPDQIKSKILLKNFTSINELIFNCDHHDIYLLHIAHEWEQNDLSNWYTQLRCFIDLQKKFQFFDESKRPIFRVLDHDLHIHLKNKPKNCVIYYINNEIIKTEDFYHSSWRHILSLNRIQIKNEWKQHAITVAGKNGAGHKLDQLCRPIGICVDDDYQCIYVADWGNNRIVEWKFDAYSGQVVAGGNEEGNGLNQLKLPTDVIVDRKTNSLIICDQGNRRIVRWPRENGQNGIVIISDIDCNGLAMDKNGDLYVSEREKHVVKRWKQGDTEGTIVAGGNGSGNRLDQLCFPEFIFVDNNYSVYVSDLNHRVTKWIKNAKEGIIVAGKQEQRNNSTELYCPAGVFVNHSGDVYVADSRNNRIMCWSLGSKEGRIVVGGYGEGQQANQFHEVKGLAFDQQNNLYAVDFFNNRVQRFDHYNHHVCPSCE